MGSLMLAALLASSLLWPSAQSVRPMFRVVDAQSAAPTLPADAAPPPLTELESMKIALLDQQDAIAKLREQYAAAMRDLDMLRLAVMMQQATPTRDGYRWDWSTRTFVPVKK